MTSLDSVKARCRGWEARSSQVRLRPSPPPVKSVLYLAGWGFSHFILASLIICWTHSQVSSGVQEWVREEGQVSALWIKSPNEALLFLTGLFSNLLRFFPGGVQLSPPLPWQGRASQSRRVLCRTHQGSQLCHLPPKWRVWDKLPQSLSF